MNTDAIFTPAEYRQFGHQLIRFEKHCHEFDILFSRAYGPGHPLEMVGYTTCDNGVSKFKYYLGMLADREYPEMDLGKFFYLLLGREYYNPPNNLPGCTLAETQQLSDSLKKRRINGKHESLTAEQLAIVVRFYSHVNQTISAIMCRVQAGGKDLGTIPAELSLSAQIIHNVLTALQREEQRVTRG
jgi:hypothetical protein